MNIKVLEESISYNEKHSYSVSIKEKSADHAKVFRIDHARGHQQRESLFISKLFALVLLVPALPIMAVCIILTKLTSRGPAIYTQKRVGYQGKLFTLYKIRSMSIDAETQSGAVWARKNDPRVTPLGKFLRWSHLDELPQLFNVLKGEMSFIGPRPERPEFVQNFLRKIERYDERLNSYPGITGIAQVCLPPDNPDAGLKTVCDKLSLEVAYHEQKHNLYYLDVRIIIATALKMVGVPRLRYTNWLALDQVIPVDIRVEQTERRIAA